MLVVRFDTRRWNFLCVGDSTYFLLGVGSERQVLVMDKCPHRGGPLHLACYDEASLKLICPWHESRVSLAWLLARAVPMVCVGQQATAFFPVPAETEVHLMRQRVKPRPVPVEVAYTQHRKRRMAFRPVVT